MPYAKFQRSSAKGTFSNLGLNGAVSCKGSLLKFLLMHDGARSTSSLQSLNNVDDLAPSNNVNNQKGTNRDSSCKQHRVSGCWLLIYADTNTPIHNIIVRQYLRRYARVICRSGQSNDRDV